MSAEEELIFNPTLSVNLNYQLVTFDGGMDHPLLSLKRFSRLTGALLEIAKRLESGQPLDMELDPDIIEEMRARQILITSEERGRLQAIRDWTEWRDDDVIVAAYPKSGTTWMQMIVYQLTSNGDLDFRHITNIFPPLPETGIVTRWLREHVKMIPGRRFFKTHGTPEVLPSRSKLIYVFRNPKDVLVSYHHHLTSTNEFRGSLDRFATAFLDGQVLFGSWFDNLEAWWPLRNQPNVLFVAYESLSEDFERCLHAIAGFCGVQIDPLRLPAIRQACSFAFMKKFGYKFDPRPPSRSGSFFRNGGVGASARELSPEIAHLVDVKTQALIRKLDPSQSAPGMPFWWYST